MRLAGRSPRELAFRLNQAVANLAIWAIPPGLPKDALVSNLALPDPSKIVSQLKGSAFADELDRLAQEILAHRLPLLGSQVQTGPEIEWRRDYIHNKVSGDAYFRFVPYLDFHQVGDHKNIWELNRHQHLVVLAQAHLFHCKQAYLDEIRAQLEGWWKQNPFLKGINWASALEVAFRALSWLWIDHLAGSALDPALRRRIWSSLYQHAIFLEHNLSTYFSPNTHLLGEAVALHAIGLKLNNEKWRSLGARIVAEELDRQVRPDGSHFEQSTYYHVYALDFFLFHYLLSGRPASHCDKLHKMARFLAAITGPERLLTCFGDDDGGRLFHPFGPRDRFARATLATCAVLFPEEALPGDTEDLSPQAAWWLGSHEAIGNPARPVTYLFRDSGLVSIATPRTQILIDAGPFGFGAAGHSHADTLSVTARASGRELLIDPGTFTYVADPLLRNAFRGTAFHNTIRINGLDQADPTMPFRWDHKPEVHVNDWRTEGHHSFLDAACAYRGFTHRRRLFAVGDEVFFILDEVRGPEGEHTIEQFWHLGDEDVPILFSDPSAVASEEGVRSRVLGQKQRSSVLRSSWRTKTPHFCAVSVSFHTDARKAILTLNELELWIPGVMSVSFAVPGMPKISRL